jgi:hypothetical protein
MSRNEFNTLYMAYFPVLVRAMSRRGYEDGADAMQSVYVSVISDRSYHATSRGRLKGESWLSRLVWKAVQKQTRERRREMGARRINETD